MIERQLTFLNNSQLRALSLYNLLQLLQIRVQPLDLIIIKSNRFRGRLYVGGNSLVDPTKA